MGRNAVSKREGAWEKAGAKIGGLNCVVVWQMTMDCQHVRTLELGQKTSYTYGTGTSRLLQAMVGNPKWSGGIVYVDLFAGAGVCTLRESGRRIPGSALLAAWAPKPFDRILICEKDPQLAAACERRLAATSVSDRVTVFVGDCNSEIRRIEREIPSSALVLAFVDPEGLHVHFDTLATLTNNRRVDFARTICRSNGCGQKY